MPNSPGSPDHNAIMSELWPRSPSLSILPSAQIPTYTLLTFEECKKWQPNRENEPVIRTKISPQSPADEGWALGIMWPWNNSVKLYADPHAKAILDVMHDWLNSTVKTLLDAEKLLKEIYNNHQIPTCWNTLILRITSIEDNKQTEQVLEDILDQYKFLELLPIQSQVSHTITPAMVISHSSNPPRISCPSGSAHVAVILKPEVPTLEDFLKYPDLITH
ncbi:hypothetical protein BT96DRAFT_998951 [Gymnopus androsaceus JB14]|uniref:Uncharacterized protein n=1 Tax=Gymnopus androsaceus JB14 TaxID=1447944 RepID=A0A6A4H881_9AGAR|nr:hypothetical protein BT96DRAFT_998951 [Gymnopus androsaceus JB14]